MGAIEIPNYSKNVSIGVGQARSFAAQDRAGEREGGAPREAVVMDVPKTVNGRAEREANPRGPARNNRGEGAKGEAEGAGDQGGDRASPGVDGIRIRGVGGKGGVNVITVAEGTEKGLEVLDGAVHFLQTEDGPRTGV